MKLLFLNAPFYSYVVSQRLWCRNCYSEQCKVFFDGEDEPDHNAFYYGWDDLFHSVFFYICMSLEDFLMSSRRNEVFHPKYCNTTPNLNHCRAQQKLFMKLFLSNIRIENISFMHFDNALEYDQIRLPTNFDNCFNHLDLCVRWHTKHRVVVFWARVLIYCACRQTID